MSVSRNTFSIAGAIYERRCKEARWVLCGVLGVMTLVGGASAQPTFTEVSDQANINFLHQYSGEVAYRRASSAGAAVGDYDGDGWQDIYVCNGWGYASHLYHNNRNGTFTEVGAQAGADLALTDRESKAALFFDYDGDGRLDLFVANDADAGLDPPPTTMQNVLFRNVGNGQFEDVTEQAQILPYPYEIPDGGHANDWTIIGGLAAGDLNGDGYLEIYVSYWPGTDQLLLNNGDGTFSDISVSAGIARGVDSSWQPVMWDVNDDGLLDIHVAIDYTPDRLWVNQGDLTFVDRAAEAGLDGAWNEMGLTVGDYDNDTDFDPYLTNIEKPHEALDMPDEEVTHWNRLYRNDSVGDMLDFMDVAPSQGVHRTGFGWGATYVDYNNDGWQDLAAVNGAPTQPEYIVDKSKLFRNDNGMFTDVSDQSGFNDTRMAKALIALDYDRDGDQDLFVTNNLESALLYRNDGGNTSGNWLMVDPIGDLPNEEAIGATIYLEAGGITQMRLITAGTSFLSQEPSLAHFGVGSATLVDSVRVTWADGSESVVNNLPVNQYVEVFQKAPARCQGDANGDGLVDPLDSGFVLARFGCDVGTGDPNCDIADMNGDGLVDPLDVGFVLARFGECP